jgi:hypothetical protein
VLKWKELVRQILETEWNQEVSMEYVNRLTDGERNNDLGCLEVCEDVLDGAGDQGDGLDLGEALGEVLNVSEEDVHENDFAKYISSRYYLISSVAKLY